MKVLADYHHHDLWESLELLCERLGFELYRPIGLDWFEQGYWNHERAWHGDAIARQYLEPWGDDKVAEAGSLRLDRGHRRWQRLVTLEQARSLGIDVIISTLAHNHEGMHRFAREIGAKFGLQIGNVRFAPVEMTEDRWDLADFGLVSGFLPAPVPHDRPHVVYHQEFSLADFAHVPPPRGERLVVSSFVQCYPQTEWAYSRMTAVAEAANEHDWRVYGSYGSAPLDAYAAGNIDHCAKVAEAMQRSDVAWHAKRWSDGYGHVFHNWYAVGRPLLGFRSYYAAQMGGALWLEGVNAWDIEHRSRDEIVGLLRRFREDEEFHLRACEASVARFREVVDFAAEADAIRRMFEAVL